MAKYCQSCGASTVKADRVTCKYCGTVDKWSTTKQEDAEIAAKSAEDVNAGNDNELVNSRNDQPLSEAQLDTTKEADIDATIMAELGLSSLEEVEKLSFEEAEENFRKFDVDQDGRISMTELQKAYAKFGVTLTDAEVETMVRDADLDFDGTLNFAEYLKMNGVTEDDHSMTMSTTWLLGY